METWGVFDCTANFGSSLHPPQTASTADSSCNRTALPQVLLETRDVTSRQNKTDAGFREVRRVFVLQSPFHSSFVSKCLEFYCELNQD